MHQHADPIMVDDDRVLRPERIHFTDHDMSEGWLQDLLFRHPDLLPVEEFGPEFAPLIPLCTELSTEAGPADVVCVSPDGLITIVETKLWRNPEARREVVAQTIDYASAVQGWDYERFEDAVRRARSGDSAFSLFGHVSASVAGTAEEELLSEKEFVDAVSRSLQSARFLLIIAGDGIREGAERMAAFLASSPQMHYTLALCELACYNLPDGQGRLVVPRTTARTAEVERAVVRVVRSGGGEIAVDVGVRIEQDPSSGSRRRAIGEEEFYEDLLEATDDDAVEAVQRVVELIEDGGVEVERKSASLAARLRDSEPGNRARYSLLVFGRGGQVYSGWLPGQIANQDLPRQIGHEHYRRLWRVLGYDQEAERTQVRDFGKEPVVWAGELIGREEEFAGAILETVHAILEAREQ